MQEWIKINDKLPEDVLKIENYMGCEITPEVLIPHQWGNEHGGGSFIPAYRYRYKKQKTWHWSVKSAKPLVWLPIPELPSAQDLREAVKKFYDTELQEKT